MESDWAGIPKHTLVLVSGKLDSSVDYLQFGATCNQWYSIIKDNQIKHHVPMLFIPREEEEHAWDIYDVMEKKNWKSKVIVPYGDRFSGSSKGWLIAVNEDYSVSLYKPLANLNIQLPILFPRELNEHLFNYGFYDNDQDEEEDFVLINYESENSDIEQIIEGPKCCFHIFKATITSDPLEDPDNCTIVVIVGEFYELAFIRPMKDTTWTKIDTKWRPFEDILHYNNRFYASNNKGELISFDIIHSGISNEKLVTRGPEGVAYHTKKYLANLDEKELLLVERYVKMVSDDDDHLTYKFKIFKLDFDDQTWVEIKSLGHVALFLGDNSTISVIVSNFDGIQSNSIYFTHDEDSIGHHPNGLCDVGVYYMETRSCDFHFTMDSTIFAKMFTRPPIWVAPAINLY